MLCPFNYQCSFPFHHKLICTLWKGKKHLSWFSIKIYHAMCIVKPIGRPNPCMSITAPFHWDYCHLIRLYEWRNMHNRTCRGQNKNVHLTESNDSKGRLSKWRRITAFPSRLINDTFTNRFKSRPPSVSFFSLSFSWTSLNIQSSELGARDASKT